MYCSLLEIDDKKTTSRKVAMKHISVNYDMQISYSEYGTKENCHLTGYLRFI